MFGTVKQNLYRRESRVKHYHPHLSTIIDCSDNKLFRDPQQKYERHAYKFRDFYIICI